MSDVFFDGELDELITTVEATVKNSACSVPQIIEAIKQLGDLANEGVEIHKIYENYNHLRRQVINTKYEVSNPYQDIENAIEAFRASVWEVIEPILIRILDSITKVLNWCINRTRAYRKRKQQ